MTNRRNFTASTILDRSTLACTWLLSIIVETIKMLVVEEMAISKFKTTCLAVLERVRKTGEPILVTRFGYPVAQIVSAGGLKARPPPMHRGWHWPHPYRRRIRLGSRQGMK
jgi:prevent-host-death family protein